MGVSDENTPAVKQLLCKFTYNQSCSRTFRSLPRWNVNDIDWESWYLVSMFDCFIKSHLLRTYLREDNSLIRFANHIYDEKTNWTKKLVSDFRSKYILKMKLWSQTFDEIFVQVYLSTEKSLVQVHTRANAKLLVPDVCLTSLPATTLFGLNVSLHIPFSHRRFQCLTQPQIEKSCRIWNFFCLQKHWLLIKINELKFVLIVYSWRGKKDCDAF